MPGNGRCQWNGVRGGKSGRLAADKRQPAEPSEVRERREFAEALAGQRQGRQRDDEVDGRVDDRERAERAARRERARVERRAAEDEPSAVGGGLQRVAVELEGGNGGCSA